MKQFISNLKLRRKFALIGILALAMVALPAWLAVRNSVATLSMVHAEAAGIAPSGDVLALIKFMQQHRARSAMVLAGNDSVQAEREVKHAEVEQIMAKAQRSVALLNDPRLDERLAMIQREWHAMAHAISEKSIDGPQSFVRHTELITGLLALLDDIVDSSTLTFGSDAATRHIVLSALGHLPRMNESLGQMRGLGALLLTRGEITREDRMRIVAIGAIAQQQLGGARGAFDRAMDIEPEWRRALGGPVASAAAAAEAALKLADEQIVRAETPSLASVDYVALMTKAIDARSTWGTPRSKCWTTLCPIASPPNGAHCGWCWGVLCRAPSRCGSSG